MKISLLTFAALALALPLAAPAAADLAIVDVDVESRGFRDHATGTPATFVSQPSIPVRWTDVSGIHTVTALDGSFDSGTLREGDVYVHTFGAPGTYAYRCAIHLTMLGVVVVAE